ncbi:hypothetical protein IEQ34_004344 [Dendrobium chrysotoxum]|uniref:Uncharacterized protein n=1 Tax=Dendrobium chrysotoxum TaxID=161865 RepID=A0AAV7HET9_DENCH|nr:hypothetical protein IEQ34_004344 [Dendrobium chrysotoxum]
MSHVEQSNRGALGNRLPSVVAAAPIAPPSHPRVVASMSLTPSRALVLAQVVGLTILHRNHEAASCLKPCSGLLFFLIYCGIPYNLDLDFISKFEDTFFSPRILHSLGFIFNHPLKLDSATNNGSRPLVTRVLVELDISKQCPNCVWIGPKNF